MNNEFDKIQYLLSEIPVSVKHHQAVISCLERSKLMKV